MLFLTKIFASIYRYSKGVYKLWVVYKKLLIKNGIYAINNDGSLEIK